MYINCSLVTALFLSIQTSEIVFTISWSVTELCDIRLTLLCLLLQGKDQTEATPLRLGSVKDDLVLGISTTVGRGSG